MPSSLPYPDDRNRRSVIAAPAAGARIGPCPAGVALRRPYRGEPSIEPHQIIEEGPSERLGSRALEISNAVARLHKQFIGRGPTNSRTTIDGDLVVCLLEGGYTRAEQTLTENDKSELVHAGRAGLQEAMRQAMIAAVQETTGRHVLSFMSANDLEHNLQVEIFVLEPPEADGDLLAG